MKAPRGQNFLYQPEWQERVAAAVGESQALLEIGGGEGGLTERLAARSQRLWVIESDRFLASGLRQRFREIASVQVVEGDFLGWDFSSLAAAARPLRVAGNLPYYITSPILLRLFDHASDLLDATVMVQREVADRILAAPGGRSFGLLSATAQFHAQPRRLFDLPPGAFRPAPKVWSTLVRLHFVPQAARLGVEREPFLRFLREAFAQKRKKLGPRFGLPIEARAETLSLDQLADVYRTVTAGRLLGAAPSAATPRVPLTRRPGRGPQ